MGWEWVGVAHIRPGGVGRTATYAFARLNKVKLCNKLKAS